MLQHAPPRAASQRHAPACQPVPPRRPGNLVQDSLSVMATLDAKFYNSFHKFGVVSAPGVARTCAEAVGRVGLH